MIKQTRLDAPDVPGKRAKLGEEFAQRRTENSAYRFRWKMVGAKALEILFCRFLKI